MKEIIVKQWDRENASPEEWLEEIRKSNEGSGNTVDCMNFNETMKGYVKYAIKDMKENLMENEDYTLDQVNQIASSLYGGLNWAIDCMTMEEARQYNNK